MRHRTTRGMTLLLAAAGLLWAGGAGAHHVGMAPDWIGVNEDAVHRGTCAEDLNDNGIPDCYELWPPQGPTDVEGATVPAPPQDPGGKREGGAAR